MHTTRLTRVFGWIAAAMIVIAWAAGAALAGPAMRLDLGQTLIASGEGGPAAAGLLDSCPGAVAVTSTADSGPGSLRQALVDVCSGGVISFGLTLPATITLTSGELAITQDVAILGPGAEQLAISGNDASRVINISAAVSVTIEGLTIRDGYATGSSQAAGIQNAGDLTLRDCVVADNASSSGAGGYLHSGGGSLTAVRTQFRNNQGSNAGGLSAFQGDLRLTDVTFAHNTSTYCGGMSVGGNEMEVIGERVTFAYNSAETTSLMASGLAGGLVVSGVNTPVRFINSTWYGNQSKAIQDNSGAITVGWYGQLSLLNCSVISNTAWVSEPASSSSNMHAAIIAPQTPVTVVVTNTLVARNFAESDTPGMAGAFTSGGHNLVSDATGATGFTHGVNGDIIGSSASPIMAMVGELGDYGGETETVPLLKHSPALDAGDDAQAPATDQRGMARPGLEASDIGAYEVQAPPEFSSRLQYFPVNPCPGYNLYSTLVITNTSEFRILHNITATVTLPAGTWFFPSQASGMDYTYDGNTIVFTADTLGPEEIALAELTIHTSSALTHGVILTTTWEVAAEALDPVTYDAVSVVDTTACGSLPEPTPTYEPTATPTPEITVTPTTEAPPTNTPEPQPTIPSIGFLPLVFK